MKILTSQPNLVMESSARLSLYPNCHHQIVLVKFNSKFFYPPPYEHKIWRYNKANTDLIVDQSMNSLEKTDFLIKMQFKKCISLMKQ